MIWVVGEKQGAGGTRRRLAELLGVDVPDLMAEVLWLNLWEYPGTKTERYVQLVEEATQPGDVVWLLGRRVQRAFGLPQEPALTTIERSAGSTMLCLPHPSGLNRWWNDPDHVDDATIVLRALWGRRSV